MEGFDGFILDEGVFVFVLTFVLFCLTEILEMVGRLPILPD